uniref:Uncharacterized protein n=1 Tax=Acrobeloides nanus TaxID=290746 RepID=A0A914BYJ3_9BILA
MILFLNKTDLFAEKIKKISLDVLFPSYRGTLDYKEGIAYLKFEFSKQFKTSKQHLYVHETCATDTNQVEIVFRSVFDMILKKNLKGLMS